MTHIITPEDSSFAFFVDTFIDAIFLAPGVLQAMARIQLDADLIGNSPSPSVVQKVNVLVNAAAAGLVGVDPYNMSAAYSALESIISQLMLGDDVSKEVANALEWALSNRTCREDFLDTYRTLLRCDGIQVNG